MGAQQQERTLAENTAKGLEALTSLLQSSLTHAVQCEAATHALQQEVSAVKNHMERVQNSLRGGPGETGLVTDLALLRAELKSLQVALEEHKKTVSDMKAEDLKETVEDRRGKWALLLALIALLGTIVTPIVASFLK